MIRHKQITKLNPEFVEKKLQEFFNEDNISEDVTTNTTQQTNKTAEAHFIAKEDMVFVGKEIINWPCVFSESDNEQLLKYFEMIHT